MDAPILVVDDNETNVMILEELLGDDYGIVTATDGAEAVEAYKQHKPGVVLMDIMMPNVNGYDATRQIKAMPNSEYVQVILVSAKASADERVKGYECGAEDYVVKPFDPDELFAKVRVYARLFAAQYELAQAKAEVVGDNDRLQSLVEAQAAELVGKRDMLVFALAELADSRDPETGQHLQRMREYCRVLAEHLAEHGPYQDKIDQAYLDAIYLAAPLHDIGKVGIPDTILLKPGRLTDEEFDLMKQHTVIGATALENVARHGEKGQFIEMAIEIARSHHEKFDGKGYPDAIAGQSIPLSARITAVADVFDALTSARVYKEAFTAQVARSMIEKDAGTHFDPAVIEAFLAVFDQLLELKHQIDEPAASKIG